MTCVMRVFGSFPDAHASMRACRLEPLPDIRTAILCCESGMFQERNGCIVQQWDSLIVRGI
jgi:hypothetical protein